MEISVIARCNIRMEAQIIQIRQGEFFLISTTMAERIIYYPSYSRFLLVDMFWLENKSTLCAVQSTRSESHAKSKGTGMTTYYIHAS